MVVMRAKVLIADDHEPTRKGIAALIARDDGFEIVAQAQDGAEAVDLAMRTQPEVAVVDIAMPVLDGVAAAKRILDACPSTKVVFLTSENWPALEPVVKSIGVAGFVSKPHVFSRLLVALRKVLEGEQYFDHASAHLPFDPK